MDPYPWILAETDSWDEADRIEGELLGMQDLSRTLGADWKREDEGLGADGGGGQRHVFSTDSEAFAQAWRERRAAEGGAPAAGAVEFWAVVQDGKVVIEQRPALPPREPPTPEEGLDVDVMGLHPCLPMVSPPHPGRVRVRVRNTGLRLFREIRFQIELEDEQHQPRGVLHCGVEGVVPGEERLFEVPFWDPEACWPRLRGVQGWGMQACGAREGR
jgi:hypothetical protein